MDASPLPAALVVLAASVLSLELLRLVLVARVLAVLALAAAWAALLPLDAQLRAVTYAAASLLAAEIAGEWRAELPAALSRRRDRRVMLVMLLWGRVFVWGATLGAAAGVLHRAAAADSSARLLLAMAATTAYYEAVEVLLLRYISDSVLPYRFSYRAVNCLVTLGLANVEANFNCAQWVMKSEMVASMSSGALLVVLSLVSCAAIVIPWNEVAHRVVPNLDHRKPRSFSGSHYNSTKFMHEDASSDDTTVSEDDYMPRPPRGPSRVVMLG